MMKGLLLLGFLAFGVGPSLQSPYREVLLFPDEGGRMTAISLRFPVGSAQDPAGEEGNAYLLGSALQESARSRLLASGGEILVEVGTEEFLVTLLSPSDRWQEGLDIVESLLFGDAFAQGASGLESVRGRVVDVLRFESGSPVREFEAARSALIRGNGAPGARPSMGTIGTVSGLSLSALDSFRRTHLRRETAVVAITGPVVPADAQIAFGTTIRIVAMGGAKVLPPLPATSAEAPLLEGGQGDTIPGTAVAPVAPPRPPSSPLRVPTSPTSAPAWSAGERLTTDRELTSTWIAAAYPLPPGSPPLLLEFLSHLVEEALNPSPPDPGLFQMESDLVWLNDRPILLISASVDPRTVARWEERILGILPEIASSPPTGSFFELTRRRFRSSLLLDLASPENRVRWAVREASRTPVGSLLIEDDLWRLDRDGVAGVAAAALPPRVRLVGPLGMSAPR